MPESGFGKFLVVLAAFGFLAYGLSLIPLSTPASRLPVAQPGSPVAAPTFAGFRPGPTSTPAVRATPPPARPAPYSVAFSGGAQKATELFPLQVGLARFEMNFKGDGNFAVWLMDSNGKNIELLANKIGAFEGSKAVGIERAGNYLLDVSANGGWAVVVTQ